MGHLTLTRRILGIFFFCISLGVLHVGCGNAGQETETSSLSNNHSLDTSKYADRSGYVTAQGSSQDALSGWVLALVDANSGVSRIASINEQGVFTLPHTFDNLLYTLVLMSPSLSLRAVLSQPFTGKDGVVDQYFTIDPGVNTLPPLILQGNVLQWLDTTGISLSGRETIDTNSNSIPDGIESTLGGTTALTLAGVDTDQDGIDNTLDPDTDGDGLIDIIDPDDDGDSTEEAANDDVFDSDSDGDLISDTKTQFSDLRFTRGAEFIAMRSDWITPSSGIGWTLKLLFQLKQYTEQPEAIQAVKVFKTDLVSLFSSSNVDTTDSEGNTTSTPWDGTLTDDSLSEDGGSEDGLWGKYITLATNKSPAANQVFIYQIEYAGGWAESFLYTMPAVTPASFVPSYDATTRTITLRGIAGSEPFVSQTGYSWIVRLYEVNTSNANLSTQVWTSSPAAGSTTAITLPEYLLESGKSYKFSVTAQGAERITGYPSVTVSSAQIPVGS